MQGPGGFMQGPGRCMKPLQKYLILGSFNGASQSRSRSTSADPQSDVRAEDSWDPTTGGGGLRGAPGGRDGPAPGVPKLVADGP